MIMSHGVAFIPERFWTVGEAMMTPPARRCGVARARLLHRRAGPVRVERPVVLPPRPLSRRAFIATARWEGAVVERLDTYFVAEVIDLASGEPASVEFDLEEVTPTDRHLCEPGALFYWTTGYETKESGQRNRVSVIAFRRTGRAMSN